jgi:hypothetical protein
MELQENKNPESTKIIAFTICTIEYLSFAISLGKSIEKNSPSNPFCIFLISDREIDSQVLNNCSFKIINPFSEPDIFKINDFGKDYTDFELCCAQKANLALYLLSTQEPNSRIIYFDSDILVFQNLEYLSYEISNHSVLICPHFIYAPSEGLINSEQSLLNAGVYNAGFFMIKNDEKAFQFLQWWHNRLLTLCKADFCKGLFVDQLWLNLAPIYFNSIKISKHLGLNVAYWNLHERKISKKDEDYFVNDTEPLVFFHFSGFDLKFPECISKYQSTYSFENRIDIKPLYQEYIDSNLLNGWSNFSGHSLIDFKPRSEHLKLGFFKKLKGKIKSFFRFK